MGAVHEIRKSSFRKMISKLAGANRARVITDMLWDANPREIQGVCADSQAGHSMDELVHCLRCRRSLR